VTDREILRLIGANVRKARAQTGMTQACLSELIGVHWQTISYLENGKYPYPVMRFARLCHALDVSANFLLDGLPEPDRKQMDKINKALVRKRKPVKRTRRQP
jgi:DNA-binding XRE family transcriptional regulator